MVLPLLIMLSGVAGAVEKPIKPLPVLAKEPKLDGELKDLAPATDFKMPESATGSSAKLGLKATFRKDTLYIGVTIADDAVIAGDRLSLTLYFPDTGTTSRGFVYTFGKEGVLPSDAELGPPAFAAKLVQAATKTDAKGWSLEVAVPARALPRFQGTKPLLVSMCVDYTDLDSATGEATKLTTCPTGDMVGGPARLPDELRKNVKIAPPTSVEGVEARATGWVGYSSLSSPMWAEADAALTPESLGELVAGDQALDPASVALPLPKQMMLHDNRPLFTVLTGRNPYSKDTCNSNNELRMAIYVIKNTTALRVLEWPAATCGLGRAMRFELGENGTLVVGYTSGATQHFVWSDDHFERSELGLTLHFQHRSTM